LGGFVHHLQRQDFLRRMVTIPLGWWLSWIIVGCDRNTAKAAEVDMAQKILSKGNCFSISQGSYRTIRIGFPNVNGASVSLYAERSNMFRTSANQQTILF
jgi:hypothetical protein